jgi:hypothetical protein
MMVKVNLEVQAVEEVIVVVQIQEPVKQEQVILHPYPLRKELMVDNQVVIQEEDLQVTHQAEVAEQLQSEVQHHQLQLEV